MFTGIIKSCGRIATIQEGDGRRSFTIEADFDMASVAIGASIACDGCCLTVVSKTDNSFTVDSVAETLALTTLGRWAADDRINLETSLCLGDEMGGHMVSGHIDGLGVIEGITPDGDSWRLKIRVPPELAHYIAPKGSVALNGISLTVNEVEGDVFGVCIIPHTWSVTNICEWSVGRAVNLEIDMLARYVMRILEWKAA